ncbi:hypothetical protein PGB90_004409 [Kerria lacca]
MEELHLDTTNSGHKPSIIIRDAYKKYPKEEQIILNGLNLTVLKGTIYALLGPSGCGKTTLLNCIVGEIALDAGSIELKVTKRSDIGYMPQFLSLHVTLTMFENLFFYGYLFGLSKQEIKTRTESLVSILQLPSVDCIFKTLSGGEQRRVSLAIAIIHRPQILILDEPTVGLDPILRQNIWNMLLDMIKEGKSIIITTHYMQEAQQADTIGLMRGGVLLAEEAPIKLVEKYACHDLEETFLELSKEQENKLKHKENISYPKSGQPVKARFEEDDSIYSKIKFSAIMYKNLLFMRREIAFIMFILVLPTVQAYIFNLVIGVKPKHIKVAVVNEETTLSSCYQSPYESCFLDENQNASFSCLFLDFLRKENYDFIEYENITTALDDVKKNKVWGLLHFPQNYTHSLAHKVTGGIFTSIDQVANGFMNTWIDLSNQYIGSFLKYDVVRSMILVLKEGLKYCGQNPQIGAIPLTFEKPIFGSYGENFITYASAAMICLCCFLSSSTSTAMLIVTEKSGGMMERMQVTGATMFEMVMSVLLIQIAGQMISIPIVMTTMYWIFENPLGGSAITLVSLLGLTGLTGVLYGTTLAVLNKDLITTVYCGVGMNIVMVLTTGLLWPIEAEHYILKNITWILPLTWIADAARGICSKSYSFLHPVVLRGFASVTVWNLIFLYVIYYCLKHKKGVAGSAKNA